MVMKYRSVQLRRCSSGILTLGIKSVSCTLCPSLINPSFSLKIGGLHSTSDVFMYATVSKGKFRLLVDLLNFLKTQEH